MAAIIEMFSRAIDQLLSRPEGPLNFRFLFMPLMVTFFAIRSGLRDAREGRKPFIWAILSTPTQRRRLFRSSIRDIGRIFIVAMVLDATYQFIVLHGFYVIQALVVAVTCAVIPYVLIRGPVTRVALLVNRNRTHSPTNPTAEGQQ